mgnify:CR=1 FL=1
MNACNINELVFARFCSAKLAGFSQLYPQHGLAVSCGDKTMRILHSLKSTASRFAHDKGGNFALAFAAASTVIMLSVGLG